MGYAGSDIFLSRDDGGQDTLLYLKPGCTGTLETSVPARGITMDTILQYP